LRIVLASDWHPLSIGGIQSHIRYLARFLKNYGLEVYVISRRTNKIAKESFNTIDNCECVFVDPILPLDIILMPPRRSELEKVICEIRPDIIHLHHAFTPLSLLSLEVAKKHNIPRVLTNHSITLGYEYSRLWKSSSLFLMPLRQLLSSANVVISVSKAADKFISNFLKNTVKRLIIPNGVDVEKYKPLKKPPENPVVLFIGRLVHRKGVHMLLEAFRDVVSEVPEARLLIVGKGYMEPIVKSMVSILNLKKNVVFKGLVSEEEKIHLLQNSMVVAVPSIYGESFGTVAVEAFAAGTPVVAFKVGGLAEIVDHGVNGFLANVGDLREIAEYLITLLLDRKLRKKMSENARLKAEKVYSWKIISRKIYRVYLTLHSEEGISSTW